MEISGGEEFLKANGLIKRRSEEQRRLLGCVGCQWAKAAEGENPTAYGYRVMQCTGLRSGTVYPQIGRLVDTGVVTLEWQPPTEQGERIIHRISPADTTLGHDFKASLTPYGNAVENVSCTDEPTAA